VLQVGSGALGEEIWELGVGFERLREDLPTALVASGGLREEGGPSGKAKIARGGEVLTQIGGIGAF
jgi:hypothetical protein